MCAFSASPRLGSTRTRNPTRSTSAASRRISTSARSDTPNSLDARFDERRIGLDHLEFRFDISAELESWRRHFDDLGIEHSGIKKPSWSSSHLLTFRDPDGIQLEVYRPSRGVGT